MLPLNKYYTSKYDVGDYLISELDLVFRKFDQTGRGTVSLDDIRGECLKQCIQLMGHNPTDADIQEYFNKIDTNGRSHYKATRGTYRLYSTHKHAGKCYHVYQIIRH